MADYMLLKMLMLMSTSFFVFSFILLLPMMMVNGTAHSVSGPHITDVNLLLPPKMTHPVEYRLQGSDGCFQWSWDHHDLLSVTPEYNVSNQCSTSARLRSIAPYSGRKETAIYATDVHTGSVIRCKVYIDQLSRIQIFHNSIKLDLDGLATLRVRAFDSEDNVFSSLVGLQFMWKLLPENDESIHHLVHVPLKDSPLTDCGGLCGDLTIQRKLEDNGVYSDLMVVKGTEIGQEVVSVHLLEPHVEHMADKIVLTVAEAMSLDPPSPVLVIIGAVIQYNLKVIHGNIPQAVTLPSQYHQWFTLNTSVAEVDIKSGVVHALTLGATTVTVEDIRVDGHIQMSSLHVVLPDTLRLYIIPLSPSGDSVQGMDAIAPVSRWYVICGHQYLIQMKVFSLSFSAQEMFITKSDDLKLSSDKSEHFKTFLMSNDIAAKHNRRNSRLLTATLPGLGKLTASLTYFTGDFDKKEVLKVLQEVMVCEPVKFSLDRPLILLPWVPGVYQEVELKAAGGCAKSSSDYQWVSSDMSIVSVSASGVVQAKKPGKATIKVVSIFDPLNHDEVAVEVSIPTSMSMLENFEVETVVGSHLQAAMTLKTLSGAYFYRCDSFNLLTGWNTESESFIIINATRGIEKTSSYIPENNMLNASVNGPPCAWTSIYVSSSGRTMLHATLSDDYYHYHAPILLKASLRIAAYSPLMVSQVGDGSPFGGYWFDLDWKESHSELEDLNSLYLVPGTHLDVMLHGGPEPWGPHVDFVETLEIITEDQASVKDGVFVQQVSSNYGGLYKVVCQTLGNFKVVFKRGNLVGIDHRLPVIAEAGLSLACSFPSSIVLLADKPVNEPEVISACIQAERCPERIRLNPVTVANGRTIRVAAVGISDSGQAFANSSSLPLSWELSSCEGLALWDDAYKLTRSTSIWEKFLVLQNYSGFCVVRATVVGFSLLAESTVDVLTDALRLQLVSTLKVDPEYNLIFFHPDAKVNLSVTGGSCFLDAAVNDTRVLEVIFPTPGLQCLQLTVSPKGLGTALVTVNDIGTTPPLEAFSMARVADVDWIKITSAEEISLMEGNSQSFHIIAGIYDGSTFDASQYAYMNIHVHIEDNIIELINDTNVSLNGDSVFTPKFRVMARRLGATTLYVSATQHSGHEIFSQVIRIEVYAPPRIHPDNIFLVPGASYEFIMKEGPSFGVSVVYSSSDDGIAKVDKISGKLSAIYPGNMTILAKVYGNGDIVICQAFGKVEVGVPSSVILNSQSEQIGIGREMPIYPSLPKGDLFSFYEVCKNYKWNIEVEEVLTFHADERMHGDKVGAICASANDSYPSDKYHGFIRGLCGRSAGRTDVSVSFMCDFVSSSYSESRSYSASLSISVVPDLPLALGSSMTWILPPHYTTTSLLPSSSESHQWDSKSPKKSILYSLLKISGGTNEELLKDNIFIDGDKLRTTTTNNLACIQAKDYTSGKLEIAACLRVAEVAQVRINSKEVPVHIIELPIGAELELAINYCDVLGYPFHEAYNTISLAVETNYRSLVSIDDTNNAFGKVNLKGVDKGRALVRVSIGNNVRKSDYVLIEVVAELSPHSTISEEGSSGKVLDKWLSAKEIVAPNIHFKPGHIIEQIAEQGTTIIEETIVIFDATKQTFTNPNNPTKSTHVIYWVSIIFILVSIIMYLLYNIIRRTRPQAQLVPRHPTTPIASASRPIGDGQLSQSPRTGTPSKEFAEYVYRTLDETPNYNLSSGGARRRGNLQNSY